MRSVTFTGSDKDVAAVRVAGHRFPLNTPVEVSNDVADSCDKVRDQGYKFTIRNLDSGGGSNDSEADGDSVASSE
jgi:hypothetical protein